MLYSIAARYCGQEFSCVSKEEGGYIDLNRTSQQSGAVKETIKFLITEAFKKTE